MAKSELQSPLRKVLSATIMWIVLGATIALAAWVSHKRQLAQHIELGPARQLGRLTYRLPATWTIARSEGAQVTVDEASHRNDSRRLIINAEELSTLLPPDAVMRQLSGLDTSDFSGSILPGTPGHSIRTSSKEEQISIAGQNGILERRIVESAEGESAVQVKLLRAAVILPSRLGVVITLSGLGRLEARDADLVRKIAASITVSDEPATDASGDSVDVGDGIIVSRPSGFATIVERDPLRVGKSLLSNNKSWTSIDLIPTVLPDDPVGAAEAQLVMFDSRWLDARDELIKEGQWMLSPANSDLDTQVFVAVAGDHRGLLAIVRSNRNNPTASRELWQELSKGLKFTQPLAYEQLSAQGAQFVSQMRQAGLQQLLDGRRQERWWLWTHDTPEHFLGWLHFSFDTVHPCAMDLEWRGRLSSRYLLSTKQRWESASQDISQLIYSGENTESLASAEDRSVISLKQTVLLHAGKLAMQSHPLNRPRSMATMPAPANFLAGGWLQLLLDRAPDQPMLVCSESATNFSALPLLKPVQLLIEPAASTATTNPSAARVLNVRVLGTFESQKWYFKADGSIDHIDLVGQQHFEPSTKEQIKFNLGDDALLQP